jgi:hopanoid biosynthesis associated RND transporter like protein HpnN
MVVLVESDTPDRASDAAAILAQALTGEDTLFKTVYLPYGGRFMDEHGLLYLSSDELQDVSDNLAAVQPFIGKLTRDQSLHGLFSMLETALEAVQEGEQLELAPLLNKVDEAIEASLSGRYYQLSWQELFQGTSADDNTHIQLIILQPRLEYSRLHPAKAAIQTIRQLAQQLQLDPAHGVRVRITGKVALAYEELQTASRGALLTGLATLALVFTVLMIGLGSWQLLVASVLTMLSGLILTAGFATFAVGSLNLISIAFAILYIGLGIDYSIHLSLRYKELINNNVSHINALHGALRDVGGSLFICTLTTATAFYVFVPTSFSGVSELGLIAGTGIVINLLLNLSLMPSLLSLLPPVRKDAARPHPRPSLIQLMRLPLTHTRSILWTALLAGITAAFLLPAARFDSNPLHLRNQKSESVIAFKELLESSNTSPWRIAVVADDSIQANQLTAQLERLDVVDKVHFLDKFIPADQDEKLAILQDLALIVGSELDTLDSRATTTPESRLKAVQDLLATLHGFPETAHSQAEAVNKLQFTLQRLMLELGEIDTRQQDIMLSRLEESLLSALPERLHELNAALNAQAVSTESLPKELLTRWVAGDGRHRIEVLPRKRLDNNADLEAFVNTVKTIAPNATESAVVNIEAGHVVVAAFTQAMLSAFLAITLLLLLLLPNKRDSLLVLLPLLLAVAITGAMTVLLHLPLNYANIIALPLLLGVGVDSAVHMVHRLRNAPASPDGLLATSTSKAVFLSAVTTICSFGSLAFSPHPGAASMGQMLTVGITTTMFCMLIVLPALSYQRIRRETEC